MTVIKYYSNKAVEEEWEENCGYSNSLSMSSSISGAEDRGEDADEDRVRPASSFKASVCEYNWKDSPKRLVTLSNKC